MYAYFLIAKCYDSLLTGIQIVSHHTSAGRIAEIQQLSTRFDAQMYPENLMHKLAVEASYMVGKNCF